MSAFLMTFADCRTTMALLRDTWPDMEWHLSATGDGHLLFAGHLDDDSVVFNTRSELRLRIDNWTAKLTVTGGGLSKMIETAKVFLS